MSTSDGTGPRLVLQPWSLEEPTTGEPARPSGRNRPPSVGVWAGPPEDPARYELLHVVGRGAEGVTWRARYLPSVTAPAVAVAVKQYRAPAGASSLWPADGTWQHVSRQFAILAGVKQNRHLVDTREVFLGAVSGAGPEIPVEVGEQSHTVPFAVMQWVEGKNPEHLLSSTDVRLDDRIRWVVGLTAAVRALHSLTVQDGNALVHGDIKPANCLIDGAGELVLLDLGAAQVVTGSAVGRGLHTPSYAAPEVVAEPGRARDLSSDAYSLGATAFHLLTGHAPPPVVPGTEGRDTEVVADLCRAPALRAIPRWRRKKLARHLLRLLAEEPARRPLDLGRWSIDLARLVPSRRTRLLRRAVLAVLVIVVLVLVAVVVRSGASNHVIDWADAPDAETLSEPRSTYSTTFGAEDRQAWPAPPGDPPPTSAEGYPLIPTDIRSPLVAAAPGVLGSTREVVRAEGRLLSGQGKWGVWCRGSDASGADRYRFLVTHSGNVGIFARTTSARGAVTETGTGWWRLTGVDLRDPVDLEARCFDADGLVVLTLVVDGHEVLEYRPDQIVLGPGSSGLETEAFTDVTGPVLRTDVSVFSDLSAR